MKSWILATPLLAGAAFAADLTLYTDVDYQGRALNLVIDERHLATLNFDDRAASVVIEKDAWVLCSEEDYAGKCITLEPGRYASLQALGLNHAVTSVRRQHPASLGVFSNPPPDTADITLFAWRDYRGPAQTIEQQQSDLTRQSLKTEAASAIISSGEWELCRGPEFRAPCVILGPGKYPSLESQGIEIGAASVRRAAMASHQEEEEPPEN